MKTANSRSPWQGTIPIYINNFNWLTSTRELAQFFDDIPGTEVVIVDNASTYPPLLDWYATCDYKVVKVETNGGELTPWNCGAVLSPPVHRSFWGSEFYVITDSDLSLSKCPKDVLNMLIEGYRSYPDANKIGLSLEIEDLPDDSPVVASVKSWESQFWQNRLSAGFFRAAVDTTFALYCIDVPFGVAQMNCGNSLRSDRPYTAAHLPWYITVETLTEEQEYYVNSAQFGHWGRHLKEPLLRKKPVDA